MVKTKGKSKSDDDEDDEPKKKKKSSSKEEPKKKKKKGTETSAYCMKCKEHVEPKKSKIVKTSNGRNMLKGTCPECGTTVVKFVA